MTTTLDVHQSFPGSIDQVRAMLTDPDYARDRAEQTGSISCEVTVTPGAGGATEITTVRVFPADLPSFASAMVGANVEVTEHQTWAPITGDSCTAPFTVSFSAPLAATGVITLTTSDTQTSGNQTSAHVTATIKSTVPFVGGKLEKMVQDQLIRYLEKDEELGRDWLHR
ncbi:MAG: DUF2505 domain-containing protein [Actinomycetota bacterium]|nr:DUF2505 domain-containing protein [Actinomycetota bacterium]